MAKSVEKYVWGAIAGIFDDSDIEVVDIEYVKEHDWYLRIYIDKPGGIGIDDCQMASEKIEAVLDADDAINESYILEVSSPGIDRVLKNERDYEREKGKKVDVALYEPINGEKLLTGELLGRDENFLHIGGHGDIPIKKISQVRLHVDI